MRTLLAVVVGLLVVAVPCYYGPWKEGRHRNFRAVEDGVLYRSGQLPPDVFDRVVKEYGIRTVIVIREPNSKGDTSDGVEQAYCEANGIRHVRVNPEPWSAPDGRVPAAENVREFVTLMQNRDALKPILIHCFAGIHRSGAQVAVYRMEFNGWSADEAVGEMLAIQPRRAGFQPDMLAYLRAYRPTGGK